MSLKSIPGFGKSGIVRTSDLRWTAGSFNQCSEMIGKIVSEFLKVFESSKIQDPFQDATQIPRCFGGLSVAENVYLFSQNNSTFSCYSDYLFTVPHKKPNLPQKICPVCQRPFTWRRKWVRDWDQVRYCSERCRRKGV